MQVYLHRRMHFTSITIKSGKELQAANKPDISVTIVAFLRKRLTGKQLNPLTRDNIEISSYHRSIETVFTLDC